tara:strand:+ start:643 stop:1428 length:786 start_codon:yes stop_codon:yes gene_type:complete
MKKLLIIIISIFFTTNAYAIKFENCYDANKLVKEKIDKIKPSSVSKKFEFLEKEKWIEDYDTGMKDFDGTPLIVMKLETPRTPEQEKLAEEFYREEKKLFKIALLEYNDKYRSKYYDRSDLELDEWKLLPKSKRMQYTYILTDENIIKNPTFLFTDIKKNKINKYYVKINLVTKGYIEGNYIDERDGSLGDFFRFNLKNGTIITSEDKSLSDNVFLKKCKLTGVKKESHYLDYWWAVILIIAITFFIFTQSGKRLKKIRRK